MFVACGLTGRCHQCGERYSGRRRQCVTAGACADRPARHGLEQSSGSRRGAGIAEDNQGIGGSDQGCQGHTFECGDSAVKSGHTGGRSGRAVANDVDVEESQLQQKPQDCVARCLLDGASLPGRILIPDIEPGAELQVSHDVTFDSEGRHQVEVRLEDDALREDNRRFLAVDVTERRMILIVDDEGQQDDASFVAAALSADPSLTGLTSEVRTSQTLTSSNLKKYDCIYLLNVRDLPADTTLLLAEYVRSGGGIVWFPGEQANVRWYSETLREPSLKLFPVPIGTVHEIDSGDRCS